MADSFKFIEAVEYIHKHIDQPLELTSIASQIGVSVSTLKRIFEQICNKSPGAFIRKLRFELAYKSIHTRQNSILETALSVGFEDHSAFSRAFKDCFGFSPSSARTKVSIVQELESVDLNDPEIVEMLPIEIQAVTRQGLYFECAPKAWSELREKLTPHEVSDDFSGLFIGIGHDNPHDGATHEDQVRFTAGVSGASKRCGMENLFLPQGFYARFKYLGRPSNLGMAFHYIYGKWANLSSIPINTRTPTFMLFDRLPESSRDHSVMIHVPVEYGGPEE